MAQAGMKPTLRASRIRPGWWILTLPDGRREGFYSWKGAMAALCVWLRGEFRFRIYPLTGEMPPIPKPEKRKTIKARKDRHEHTVIDAVRREVALRDGYCRLQAHPKLGGCHGPSEWAHLPEARRSQTRGRPAEERHQVQLCVLLCTKHHNELDGRALPARTLTLTPATPLKANGPLRATRTEIKGDESWTTVCTVEIPLNQPGY